MNYGTKLQILDGAHAVLATSGVRGLTVESAAAHCRISRGAIFYHFPTKRVLINALLEWALSECDNALRNCGIQSIRAAILGLFSSKAAEHLRWALLSAVCTYPELLAEMKPEFTKLYDDMLPTSHGGDAGMLFMSLFASDIFQAFGIPPAPTFLTARRLDVK